MKNKAFALLIILAIYLVAVAAAIGTIFALQDIITNAIWLLLIADVVATVVVFIASLIFRNASVYDAYWSVAPPLLFLGYYLLCDVPFSAYQLFVIIPICIWAVRLTWNWAMGFTNLKWQDWRYTDIKAKFPRTYILLNFLGIMMMPTLLVFAGCVPFFYIINGAASIVALACGGAIMLVATIYQAMADAQKRAFLKDPNNRGKCINKGLWQFSRHPNYFGEIMLWWGLAAGATANFSPYSLIGAIAITLLFMFISVPMIERHMSRSRPQAFQEYKVIVRNKLIPRFPETPNKQFEE